MNSSNQTTGEKPSDLNAKPSTITTVARIAKGRCTCCQADLTGIIADIKAGKASIPDHCPTCGSTFVKNRITELVTTFRCGGCGTCLPEGGATENIYCRHCGVILDWSNVQPKRG
ncbi:MAG: hypothetical protein HUU49_02335 [Candidatus Buchananbacteria bacterium]|nr:hypothetical protein [Candidatus Buchananbacteria bacterium]